jgi:hypothetical protein
MTVSTSAKPLMWRPSVSHWLFVLVAGLFSLLALAAVPSLFMDVAMGLGLLFLFLAGTSAVFAWQAARQNLATKVALYPDRVVVGSLGHTQTLDLTEVAGVVVARLLSWSTWLLMTDGREVRLGAPGLVFAWRAQSAATPDQEYWSRVASSPSGRQAQSVFEAALAVQGPGGPIAASPSLRDVLGASENLGTVTRCWSPSGETYVV